MGYYLLDHPNPNYPQTRPRSAWGWAAPSGLVTVHTAEGALDRIAPDTGAENVANFIATRRDAGGYHVLCDTDSTIHMAPDDLMTWHTAAGNLNGPGWGVSAACRSTEWDPDADWTRQIISRMGAAIREFWERQHIDPRKAAVWLKREQGLGAQVGLVHHGVVQPGDRSDAWVQHPRRPELDRMLVDAIVGKSTPNTPPPIPTPPIEEEEDEHMKSPRPCFSAPKGTYGCRPDGKLAYIGGPDTLAKLTTPNQGNPAELQPAVSVSDGTLDTLLAFYGEAD